MYPYPSYQNYPQYQPYQQPIQQNIQQPVSQIQTQQILAWVQSEEEAVKYPLSAGQSLFLMNQNDSYLYMKSVDQLGKTTFIKKRLVDESGNQEKEIDLSAYITREELENLINDKIQKEVERRVSQISFKPTRQKKVIDDED
ncbi:MAG: hypothetical protein J6Y78_08470 [Paludibacteraceae bacterium]|nr:hypothetical protein [Paludibacteraceae bacterium]